MASKGQRLLNLGLRGVTLCTRFLFIFFLARYVAPASVGYYGLFAATVGYALYFVGLDFYTYNTRELLRAPHEQRGRLIRDQVVLTAGLYALLLPAAFFVPASAGWPSGLAWWFLPILVLEHVNQEVSRILIALSDQIGASVLLFIRQGSWALLVVAVMAWDAETRHLQAVMASWAGAGVVAAILGACKIARLRLGGWRLPVDWGWLRQGIKVSVAFLAATLALRALQIVDRYWLKALVDIDAVGAYVLFTGIASTLMVFLDAGVFTFSYPELIQLHQQGRHDALRQRLRAMLGHTLLLSAAFAFVSWLVLPQLLTWIRNPVYAQYLWLYPWVLLAVVVNALGLVPHYALYAYGVDRPIIRSHVAALVVFPLAVWGLSRFQPVLAVPLGLNVAFATILVWKATACFQVSRSAGASATVPQATKIIESTP
jgi:O-antigen/teichoic acid export membrane protein